MLCTWGELKFALGKDRCWKTDVGASYYATVRGLQGATPWEKQMSGKQSVSP